MTVALREQYLNRADNEARIAMVSQRSGRMLAVGAKRIPAWGGPLATLAIAIIATLTIKYVKHLIREHRCKVPVAQRTEQARPKRKVVSSIPTGDTTTSNQRKEIIITENTTPAAPAPEATDPAAREAAYLKLARELRVNFQRSVRKEAARQYSDGNITRTDKVELLGFAGIVDKGDQSVRVLIPVTTTRVYTTSGNKTADEIVAGLKAYSPYDLSRLSYASDRDSVPHWDQIEGLPEEKAPDAEKVETVESVMAEIEKAKQDIRDWVKTRRQKWCESGVDTALENVGVEKLVRPKYWILTRPLAGGAGTATLDVLAETEDEARTMADWSKAVVKGVVFTEDTDAVTVAGK